MTETAATKMMSAKRTTGAVAISAITPAVMPMAQRKVFIRTILPSTLYYVNMEIDLSSPIRAL